MCARSTEEIGKGFRLEDNRFAFKQRLAKIKGAFHEYGTLKIIHSEIANKFHK